MKKIKIISTLFFVLFFPLHVMAMLVRPQRGGGKEIPAFRNIATEEGREYHARQILKRAEQRGLEKEKQAREKETEERLNQETGRVQKQKLEEEMQEHLANLVKEQGEKILAENPNFDTKQEYFKKFGWKGQKRLSASNPVKWVRTTDGVVPVNKVYAEKMLKLSVARKGNSKDNPIDLSYGKDAISSSELKLLFDAFGALEEGTFEVYYEELEAEDFKLDQEKSSDKSRLFQLLDVADKVGVEDLSYVLKKKRVGHDIMHNVSEVMETVAPGIQEEYLKREPFKDTVCRYLKTLEMHSDRKLYVSSKKAIDSFTFNGDNTKCLIQEVDQTGWNTSGRIERSTIFQMKDFRGDSKLFSFKQERYIREHEWKLLEFNQAEDRIISYNNNLKKAVVWNAETQERVFIIDKVDAVALDKKSNLIVVVQGAILTAFNIKDGNKETEISIKDYIDRGVVYCPEVSVYCDPEGKFVSLIVQKYLQSVGMSRDIFVFDHQYKEIARVKDSILNVFCNRGRALFTIEKRLGAHVLCLYDVQVGLKRDCLKEKNCIEIVGARAAYGPLTDESHLLCSDDGTKCLVEVYKPGSPNEKVYLLFKVYHGILKHVTSLDKRHHEYNYLDYKVCPDGQFLFLRGGKDQIGWFCNSILLIDADKRLSRLITFDKLHSDSFKVVFDKDGKSIFVQGASANRDFGIYKIPLVNNDALINRMEEELTPTQWSLLYRLYLAKEKKSTLKPDFKNVAIKELKKLPEDIKEVITNVFSIDLQEKSSQELQDRLKNRLETVKKSQNVRMDRRRVGRTTSNMSRIDRLNKLREFADQYPRIKGP